MFLTAMVRQRKLAGYYENGLFFGPLFLEARHRELRKFFHHDSKLVVPQIFKQIRSQIDGLFYPDSVPTKDELYLSWHTLMVRCRKCRKKHLRAKREGLPYHYDLDDRLVVRINRHRARSEAS